MKFLFLLIALIFSIALGANAETKAKQLTAPAEIQLLVDTNLSTACPDMAMLDELSQQQLQTQSVSLYTDPPVATMEYAGILPDVLPEGIIWLLLGMIVTWLLGKLNILKFKSVVGKAEGFNDQTIIVLENLKSTLEKLNLKGAAKFVDELDDIPIEMRDVFKLLRIEIIDGDVSVTDLKSIFLESKDVFREVKELVAKKKETPD